MLWPNQSFLSQGILNDATPAYHGSFSAAFPGLNNPSNHRGNHQPAQGARRLPTVVKTAWPTRPSRSIADALRT